VNVVVRAPRLQGAVTGTGSAALAEAGAGHHHMLFLQQTHGEHFADHGTGDLFALLRKKTYS